VNINLSTLISFRLLGYRVVYSPVWSYRKSW